MSQATDPQREQPSTYFVEDRSNQAEFIRLQIQDQMITEGMGGVLPEQPDPTIFHNVLDVACGTGGWLIEAAKTYPNMKKMIGIDISGKMLGYAREVAATQQVAERVEFQMMDALLILEFPNDYFDLVNLRYGMSWLRTWDWSKLLREMQRITRPGGVIRITDSDYDVDQSHVALRRLNDLFLQVFYRTGHLFTPDKDGMISQLAELLRRSGCQDVQTCSHTLEFRASTPAGQRFYEDVRLVFQTAVPFFRKWVHLPDDYAEIYQQMLQEVQQPNFVETSTLLTAWGTVPR